MVKVKLKSELTSFVYRQFLDRLLTVDLLKFLLSYRFLLYRFLPSNMNPLNINFHFCSYKSLNESLSC